VYIFTSAVETNRIYYSGCAKLTVVSELGSSVAAAFSWWLMPPAGVNRQFLAGLATKLPVSIATPKWFYQTEASNHCNTEGWVFKTAICIWYIYLQPWDVSVSRWNRSWLL